MKKIITICFCLSMVVLLVAFVIKKGNENKGSTSDVETENISDVNLIENDGSVELIDDYTANINAYQIKNVNESCEITTVLNCRYSLLVKNVHYNNILEDVVKENTIDFESSLKAVLDRNKKDYFQYIDESGNLDGEKFTYMYVEITLSRLDEKADRFAPLGIRLVSINDNTVSLEKGLLDCQAKFVSELYGSNYLNFMKVIQMNKGETGNFLLTYIIPYEKIDTYAIAYDKGGQYNKGTLQDASINYIKLKSE
ncbi:MAG: hypothetical protein ACI4D4_00285 [Lachnospira sp.]